MYNVANRFVGLLDQRPGVDIGAMSPPVPFGGALIYVPVEWVRPANIGMDQLTAVYVSMGITPPAPR